MSRKILEDLWQVGGNGLTDPGDAAVYLIRCGDRAALIDAGCGRAHQRMKANIDTCLQQGATLSHLLLTHCHYDHTGGAEAVRQTYGCQIVAHAEDADYLETGDSEVTAASWYGATVVPLPVDLKLHQAVTPITIGNRTVGAHHWPGHSPGSLVYTAVMEDKLVLFGQDVHGPIYPALRSDAGLYQRSLRQLEAMAADLLLEGHFGIIEGRQAVRKFIRSFIIYDRLMD